MLKKASISLFLVLIIVLSFSFVWMKSSARGAADNYFNARWRTPLSRSFVWRKILGLHYDGDARSDFLGKRGQKIMIKVIPMEGVFMSYEMLDAFSGRVAATTGKPTEYMILGAIPAIPEATPGEIAAATEERRKAWSLDYPPTLYLVVGAKNRNGQDQTGSTFLENGIILYEEPLNRNYKNSKNLQTYQQYALAILLHEFGHQIGLDHNGNKDCLMNEQIELSGGDKVASIIADFCSEEKEDIRNMLF